jgi:hypothetical protein
MWSKYFLQQIQAEDQLLPAYVDLKATLGSRHALTRQTVSRLRQLYAAWGKHSQAALYRKSFATYQKNLPAISNFSALLHWSK